MNLVISGHHLNVTPALREYVLTKLDRVTRHFDQVFSIAVLLTVEKVKEKERRQKAEVTLHVKGKKIFVEKAHADLYAAIDLLMGKLDCQVIRHKSKVQNRHHPAVKRAPVPQDDGVTSDITKIRIVQPVRPAVVLGDFTVASAHEQADEVIRRAMQPLAVSDPPATSTA